MCFTLPWIEHLLVWLIGVIAAVAIIRLIVPLLTGWIGGAPIIAQIINIILWAVVAIACVYIVFGLLSCVLGGGLSLMPPHR